MTLLLTFGRQYFGNFISLKDSLMKEAKYLGRPDLVTFVKNM